MEIVITGSVAFDYLMTFPGRFQEHILPEKLDSISLSFLVDSMVRRRGGIAPNIAYTMTLLGTQAKIFATVGEDFEEYRMWLEMQGVDTSIVKVIPGVFTASFFVNTDTENNQIASFFPGAMAYAAELSFYDLEERPPDLVVISPNDPKAMKQYVQECIDLDIPYIYDPSQQIVRLEEEDLRLGVEGAKSLFANDYEFSLIQKKTGMDESDILGLVDFLVITLGEKGTRIHMKGGGKIEIPVIPPRRITDPTGIGDAFRGGFLTGFSRGWDLELCGKIGVLCATYCLEEDGPQGHRYETSEFIDRFRHYFEDGGALDELLKGGDLY